jgi:5'-nucleotidase
LPLREYEDRIKDKPLNARTADAPLTGLSDTIKTSENRLRIAAQTQLKSAIITARNAPAHERLITTLRSFDIIGETDNLFLTGRVEALSGRF